MREFISEDDLKTFEGWLKYQAVDATTTPRRELAMWRSYFDEARARSSASPKVGLMKLQPVPSEHLYAVAVREGCDLWLTLWIRRSWKGEFFVMIPCGDQEWDPHTSYHLDGTVHLKSFGQKHLSQERQPLTEKFQGTVNLGNFMGHNPKYVGAVCDPAVFSGVVEVAPGVLGPRNGGVVVDLVGPGCEPLSVPNKIVRQEVFCDTLPCIVIRIVS